MSRSHKKPTKAKSTRGDSVPQTTGRRTRTHSPGFRSDQGDGERASRSLVTWIRAKRPVLGFVLLFAVLMGAFYGITFIDVVESKVFPAYMRANATGSAALLNLFGEGATVQGTSVRSARYSVDIQHGCDAIEPSALFLAAVLAFPAPMRSKLPGLLLGTLVLAAVNLVRIVSLFYTGIYRPTWFEIVHVDVWQPVFILLSLTFWVVWAWWATGPRAAAGQRMTKAVAK